MTIAERRQDIRRNFPSLHSAHRYLWRRDDRPTCTLCRKKEATWCLTITLADVDRFSKLFHRLIREKISMYAHKNFYLTCYMLLHYLVKVENPKNVTDFDSILNKLLTCFWGHFEHLIWHLTVVRQTVSRLRTLSDWLTFRSLSDDVSNQPLNLIHLNIVASWRFFTMIIFTPSSFFLVYT